MKIDNKFVTTSEDAAKSQLLSYQEAVTRIKMIMAQYVSSKMDKALLEKEIIKVLKDFRDKTKVDAQTLNKYVRDLQRFANAEFFLINYNMKQINQRYSKSIGIDLNQLTGGKASAIVSNEKFRGYVTSGDKGLSLIKDYQKLVRSELKRLAASSPKSLGSNGKVVATRNQIECKVRHDVNMQELEEYKNDTQVKLVYISSHVDCSKRCQKWQGKLYSLDGTTGTIDGIKYEPIENAMNDNTFGDGNSIINGYNCRHYLIPYQKGMKAPKEYNATEIKKQRAIDQRQRNYENLIRNTKMQQQVMIASGNTEEAKKLSNHWHELEKKYQKFSISNNRAFYTWRTQVLEDEYNKYETD